MAHFFWKSERADNDPFKECEILPVIFICIFSSVLVKHIQSETQQKTKITTFLYKQAGAGKRFFSAPALSMFFYPGYAFL